MKVLQVSCNDLSNGGVQNVFMNIIANMPDCDFDLVVFGDGDDYYKDEFLKFGGRIFSFPIYQGNNKYIAQLDRILWIFRLPLFIFCINRKYGNYDVIHCHNYFESFLCNFGAYLSGINVRISHCHNSADPSETKCYKLYTSVLRMIFKRYTNVKIGCSSKANEYLYGDDNDVLVINNFIKVNTWLQEKRKYKTPDGKYLFVHIGRFCYQKNQLFMLEVFKEISLREPDARLAIMGYGNDEKKLRSYVEENMLSNLVTFYPHDYNKYQLLAESNYMIFPSISEGFGIALLEAQIMDCLCFVSDAIPENTDMGLEVRISLEKTTKQWAEIILKCIKDRCSYCADEKKINKFDMRNIMKKYRLIYKNINERS